MLRMGLTFAGSTMATPLFDTVPEPDTLISLADGKHKGVRVALYLDPDSAKAIAIKGGEAASDLHLTLCYCDGDIADALPIVEEFAKAWSPLEGAVDGVSSFEPSEGSDGKRPIYAVPIIDGLEAARGWLADALTEGGIPPNDDYDGWVPHITLQYVEADEQPTITLPDNIALAFDTITVIQGDERHDFPLDGGDIDLHRFVGDGIGVRACARCGTWEDAPEATCNRDPRLCGDEETERPAPASDDEIETWLASHDGWEHTADSLQKHWRFDNRRIAAAFVQEVMDHANTVNHHPNIVVDHEYVSVVWFTRASDAITARDFECAEYTDLASQNPETLSLRLTFRETLEFNLAVQRNRCGQFGDDDTSCPVPRASTHLANASHDDLLSLIDGTPTFRDKLMAVTEPQTERTDEGESMALRKKIAAPAKTRKSRRLEQKVMSLHDIPKRLDAGVAHLKSVLPDALLAVTRSAKGARKALAAVIETAMHDIADYGATEVRRELKRQGAVIRLTNIVADQPKVSAAIDRCVTSLFDEFDTIHASIVKSLKPRTLSVEKRRKSLREQLERRIPALANRYARRAINMGFSVGRTSELHQLRTATPSTINLRVDEGPYIIERVIQTAVLDANVCDPCSEVDGKVMDYGSDEQQELEPPYYRCLGADFCRCLQIGELKGGGLLDIVDGEITDDSGNTIDAEEVISVDDEDTVE